MKGVGLLVLMGIVSGLVWESRLIPARAQQPSVMINEFAWAGSSTAEDDEWIELTNQSGVVVDLSGWKITRANAVTENNTIVTFVAGTVIEDNGFLIVSRHHPNTSALNTLTIEVGTKMVLADSGLRLRLWKPDEALPVDEATGFLQTTHDKANKVSTERIPDSLGWQSSSAINHPHFDSGVVDRGTPGDENSVALPPPTIVSVTPGQAELSEPNLIITSLIGTNFSITDLPMVKLSRAGINIVGEEVVVTDSSTISHVSFSITGVEPGSWDIVVTNPDGQSATLLEAIELIAAPPDWDLNPSIRINEVVPSPNNGVDYEFVEIINDSETAVNLDGWQLDDVADGGSASYDLSGRAIAAGGFLTLYKIESGLTLNDDGDSVRLIWPTGEVVSETSYNKASRGESWSRFDNGFAWSQTLTPNTKNKLSLPPDEGEIEEDTEEIAGVAKGTIVLSELLPNPNDNQEEFIEIYNPGNKAVALAGWKIKDKSNRTYTLGGELMVLATSDLEIRPGEYLIILGRQSKIALNNSGGETVELLGPDGGRVDMVEYPDKAPVGSSYSKTGTGWQWVITPSPGQVNILSDDEVVEASPTVMTEAQLPVTGVASRRWWGIGLASLALTAILVWYKRRDHEESFV